VRDEGWRWEAGPPGRVCVCRQAPRKTQAAAPCPSKGAAGGMGPAKGAAGGMGVWWLVGMGGLGKQCLQSLPHPCPPNPPSPHPLAPHAGGAGAGAVYVGRLGRRCLGSHCPHATRSRGWKGLGAWAGARQLSSATRELHVPAQTPWPPPPPPPTLPTLPPRRIIPGSLCPAHGVPALPLLRSARGSRLCDDLGSSRWPGHDTICCGSTPTRGTQTEPRQAQLTPAPSPRHPRPAAKPHPSPAQDACDVALGQPRGQGREQGAVGGGTPGLVDEPRGSSQGGAGGGRRACSSQETGAGVRTRAPAWCWSAAIAS